VDQDVLDILVQTRRAAKAAKRFFRKLLTKQCRVPRVLVTDKLRSRCATCHEQRRSVRYDNASYKTARARLRANARVCWICGQGPRPDDPWEADHVTGSELRPAHRSCNRARTRRPR